MGFDNKNFFDGQTNYVKANDNEVVHLMGSEIVSGLKTFSSPVAVSGTNADMLNISSNSPSGTNINLINTSYGGHAYQFYSTGSGNSPGLFGVYDGTAGSTPMGISGSGLFISTCSNGLIGFGGVVSHARTPDTAISRVNEATMAIGNGIQGDYSGTLLATTVKIYGDFNHKGNKVGFFNTTPITKPIIEGDRGSSEGITSLLSQLSNLGLITDNTEDNGASLKSLKNYSIAMSIALG